MSSVSDKDVELDGGAAAAQSGRRRRRLRAPLAVAVLGILVLAAGGCIMIKSQTTFVRTPGVISLVVTVCAADEDHTFYADCDRTNVAEPDLSVGAGDDAPDDQRAQFLVGFRVPEGTAAPESFASDGGGVIFTRNTEYTAALTSLHPPPAGMRWFGYRSTPKIFDLNNDPGSRITTIRPEFTLATQANGAPVPGAFLWRAVVGLRPLANENDAGLPVECTVPTVCVDTPAPPETRVPINLSAAVSDFGVLDGATATAGHGQTATAAFPMQYLDGAGKGAQDFELSATTNLPGTTATPSVTTLHMEPDSNTTVNVSVPVPPATPLGDYTVTLSAAKGGVTRSNTATIKVIDNRAPSIRISSPANGASFVIGRVVAADYACTEETNGSGLKSCTGPVANGAAIDTSSIGPKTFTVTGVDKAGNSATATNTYAVRPKPAPEIKVSFNFARSSTFTMFTKLVVKKVPAGSKVTAKCRPPKGKRCPVRKFTKRNASGKVKLKSFIDKRFKPGSVIDVRVTRPDSIGAVRLVKIHSDSAPTIKERCLPLGATKPQRC